jgi:hypothetical protein
MDFSYSDSGAIEYSRLCEIETWLLSNAKNNLRLYSRRS